MRQWRPAGCLAMTLIMAACSKMEEPATEATEAASEATEAASGGTDAQANGYGPIKEPTAFCKVVARRTTLSDCADLAESEKSVKRGVAAFNAPGTMIRDRSVQLQLAVGYAPPEVEPTIDPIAEAEASAAALDASAAATEAAAAASEAAASASDAAASAAGAASEAAASTGSLTRFEPSAQTPADALAGQGGTIREYRPYVGRHMRATLIGQGFKIEPLTEAEQILASEGVTSWEWNVTPLEQGPHTLTLKTVVLGKTADGKSFELPSTIRNQTVEIKLTTWQKILDVIAGLPDVVKLLTAAVTAISGLLAAIWGIRKIFGSGGAQPPAKRNEGPPPP